MMRSKKPLASRFAFLVATFVTSAALTGCTKQEAPSGLASSSPPPPTYNKSGARMQAPPPGMQPGQPMPPR